MKKVFSFVLIVLLSITSVLAITLSNNIITTSGNNASVVFNSCSVEVDMIVINNNSIEFYNSSHSDIKLNSFINWTSGSINCTEFLNIFELKDDVFSAQISSSSSESGGSNSKKNNNLNSTNSNSTNTALIESFNSSNGLTTFLDCDLPYIEINGDCCLDEDNNSVCDDIDFEDLENGELSRITGFFISIFGRDKNISFTLVIMFVILVVSIMFIFIMRVKFNVAKKKIDNSRVSILAGKQVYSHGSKIGKVREIYINDSKISNWLISLDEKIASKYGKKDVMIPHSNIESVGDVVMLKHEV